MKKIPYLIIAVLILSTISWFVFGGKSTLAPADQSADTSQSSDSNVKRITITNLSFSPDSVTVESGTTVRWVNNDKVEHAIATVDGSGSPDIFDSASIAVGSTYTLQLNKPGTYKYYCKLHPAMKGEIIVK